MLEEKRKILVIMPRFPYPEAGACEQDRAEGVRQLLRLGFDVRVIAKYFDWQDPTKIQNIWKNEGVLVDLVPYQKNKKKWQHFLPWNLDGAAFEYRDRVLQEKIVEVRERWKPDIVWFDYTYLWPLYSLFTKKKIPMVVRSVNYEATHFLDEDGRTILNRLKSIPKYISEWLATRKVKRVYAITPLEKRKYEKLTDAPVENVPLRSLNQFLGKHEPKETHVLHIFFSGSTYNVSHNRRALEFILTELAPEMQKEFPDKYIFHIFGAKFPSELQDYVKENVRVEGFVEDLEEKMKDMDIAVSPSFFGSGMQQKIFEPLARGFPVVTNKRGLAGYEFENNVHLLLAETPEEFKQSLLRLADFHLRQKLSHNAQEKSKELFSAEKVDRVLRESLISIL